MLSEFILRCSHIYHCSTNVRLAVILHEGTFYCAGHGKSLLRLLYELFFLHLLQYKCPLKRLLLKMFITQPVPYTCVLDSISMEKSFSTWSGFSWSLKSESTGRSIWTQTNNSPHSHFIKSEKKVYTKYYTFIKHEKYSKLARRLHLWSGGVRGLGERELVVL